MNSTRVTGLSIIMPTYNGERLIQEAILSTLNQQVDFPLELLIMEDGSSDTTVAKIEALNDDRIHIISTSRNIGTAAARNLGLQHARYEWVAFNDQDDVWVRDKLKWQVGLLDANPDIDGVAGGYARLANDGHSRWEGNLLVKKWSPQHLLPLEKPPYYYPAQEGTAYVQSLLVRKQVISAIGGFRENLPVAYDPDIMLRLGEVCQLGAVDDVVFLYRLAADSITAPGRLQATKFLSGFAYCYAAQQARIQGQEEPSVEAFIQEYQVTDADVSRFKINQALREINTRWVNFGLYSAIASAIKIFLKHPILFTQFAVKRLQWWNRAAS